MKHAEFGKSFALALAGALTMTSGGVVAQTIDYGDLIKLYRDADGVPYLTADSCWQPLPSEDCVTTPPDGCTLAVAAQDPGILVVPVDSATCGVVGACATCTQEVDFGRVNEARSSDAVFDSQLEDVLINLATTDCAVSLDPAGRLVTGTVVEVDEVGDPVVWSMNAIDSPLQNLAIYRQLILTGDLGIPLPEELNLTLLQTAARGVGVANDKGGSVDVDKVVYLNKIMGLDQLETTFLGAPICILRKQEVQGTIDLVEECFLNYGTYAYERLPNFSLLPDPPYIPEGTPAEGTFEYLGTDDGGTTFTIKQDFINLIVFADEPGFTAGNIGGFAQAADDTRAVINYMHTWPVPAEFATPMPCTTLDAVTYDLAISDVSGLQVPKNIVDGSEGREFFVNVVNNGDEATATVTVTAIAESGGIIDGSPWVYTFTIGDGETFSQTQFFTVDLGGKDTINWTATVVGAYDVNPTNNTVYATSSVRTTGGGGGGGGRP